MGSMAAKLPANLTEPKQRELSDLAVGETAYVLISGMCVSKAGECYLDAKATVFKPTYGSIRVDRREDGYHVTVIAKGTQWSLRPGLFTTTIPVMSVSEDYDPELEMPWRS